jgi:hypothetical protein
MRRPAAIILSLCLGLASCTIRDKQPETKVYGAATGDPYAPAYGLIAEGETMLQDGDLVVRNGQEFSSQHIKNFNRTNKNYSHAGMVFFENGHPIVYHILPGDENPGEKLKKDSLHGFCNPRKNFGYAIYRYNIGEKEKAGLHSQFQEWYRQGVKFDSLFSFKSDDRMYCSEMICKALAKVTNKRIVLNTTQLTPLEAQFYSVHLKMKAADMIKEKVIAIDNLFIHPQCRLIKAFEFGPR